MSFSTTNVHLQPKIVILTNDQWSSWCVMTPSHPGLEKEEELELGLSDGDGTSLLECLERPGTGDNAVPGPPGIGGGGWSDRVLSVLKDTGEDRLQTGSDIERQQILSDVEQLSPIVNLRAERVGRRQAQRTSVRLLWRRLSWSSTQGTPSFGWLKQRMGEVIFVRNNHLLWHALRWPWKKLSLDSCFCPMDLSLPHRLTLPCGLSFWILPCELTPCL